MNTITILMLSLAPAAVPDVVTVTAILEEKGVPVDRHVAASFILWDAPSGGNSVWIESNPDVDVDQGLLVAELGLERPLTREALAGPRWLELIVDGERLEPRTHLNSVPYAIEASRAEECSSLDGLSADDVVTHDELTWDNVEGVPDILRALSTSTLVPLRVGPPGCGNIVTISESCVTLLCSNNTFHSCDGQCGLSAPASCPTFDTGGYLIQP